VRSHLSNLLQAKDDGHTKTVCSDNVCSHNNRSILYKITRFQYCPLWQLKYRQLPCCQRHFGLFVPCRLDLASLFAFSINRMLIKLGKVSEQTGQPEMYCTVDVIVLLIFLR